jgi:hypothetical protein
MGFQQGQRRIRRLRILQERHRSRRHSRSFTKTIFIGFASRGDAVSPQLVRAQRRGANPNKMFHRQGAPKAGMGRNASWNWQPRHEDQIAAVEVIVQERTGAWVVFARQHQSGAVELHVVEQPSAHRGQISNGLDVMIAPTREQPNPPATALLAKEQDPVGLDQGGESSLLTRYSPTHRLRCCRVRLVSL